MNKRDFVDKERAVHLPQDEMPTHWCNILPDLPEPLLLSLDQKISNRCPPEHLMRIFAKELIMQELSTERFIKIPDEV